MASKAILRRRKTVSDYLNTHVRSIQSSQTSALEKSCQSFDSIVSTSITDHISQAPLRDNGEPSALCKKLLDYSTLGIIRQKACGIRAFNYGNRSELNYLMGVRLMSQSRCYASTATAKQPDLGSDDVGNEERAAIKRKEASPKECDQAVVGLSTAKAKAKAKQLQESQSKYMPIIKKLWTTFLGIGPALRAVASMSKEDWAKKLIHWKNEFVSTLLHYWLGCKLLWADVRISSRLLLKLAGGRSFSRRERQQLTRTTADVFRLVPFAVFIIVPFMEFLLPVFLKLFPNMLPSTFQDKMKEQEALKRRLNAKIEYAKFLQETVQEMAKEVQNSRSGETKKTAEDLDEFLSRVRTGAGVSNEEILGFAKLFNDELTLDNISRPRLVNMCKYMGISSIGTDAYLRYMLRKRLQSIKNDDKLIQAEGVESLSEAELREDCRERGMLGVYSVEEMRQQLRDWLDLSLNYSVPSSLLILSRAFTVSGKLKPEEAVRATLSSLPDEVVDTVGITSLPSEDSVSERRRKLDFLEMQEELIKLRDWLDLSLNYSVPSSLLILSRAFTVSGKLKPEEAVRATLSSLPDEVVDTVGITSLPSEDSVSERRRKLDFLEMQEELIKEEEEKEEEVLARKKESSGVEEDVALKEMTIPTAREAQEAARARALDKQEQLCQLSRALAVLASASSVSQEREEFLTLVNREIELYNSIVDKDGTNGEVEAMEAYRAVRDEREDGDEVPKRKMVSSALIDRVDTMLQNLEKEIDDVDAKIGDHWRILDRDHDGKVTPEEVAAAAMYLKDTLGKAGIQELISNLSKDAEGKILVEDIVRLGSRVEGGSTAESE